MVAATVAATAWTYWIPPPSVASSRTMRPAWNVAALVQVSDADVSPLSRLAVSHPAVGTLNPVSVCSVQFVGGVAAAGFCAFPNAASITFIAFGVEANVAVFVPVELFATVAACRTADAPVRDIPRTSKTVRSPPVAVPGSVIVTVCTAIDVVSWSRTHA
jgi:hypothetical protein